MKLFLMDEIAKNERKSPGSSWRRRWPEGHQKRQPWRRPREGPCQEHAIIHIPCSIALHLRLMRPKSSPPWLFDMVALDFACRMVSQVPSPA